MKYCIFKFDFDRPKVAKSSKNLATDPYSYEKCLMQYYDIISKGNYSQIYFIVDFGYLEYAPFYKAIPIDYYNYNPVPWLLISHKSKDKDNTDNIMIGKAILSLKGFSEEFIDFSKAMTRYSYYMDKKIKCELKVDIFDKQNVYISNTETDIHKRNFDKGYCKKYKI